MQATETKFLIYGVKTLTDARYFTAMGVEYLHFELDPKYPSSISEPNFHEIIEWVEGPKILCSFDHWFDETQINNLLKRPQIAGVVSSYVDLLTYCQKQKTIEAFHRSTEHRLKLSQYPNTDPNEEPFELSNTVAEAIAALKNHKKNIALLAGDEVEVGIKDFEAYDTLFFDSFDN